MSNLPTCCGNNQSLIVLASTSPYRKLLLSRLGLEFTTASPAIDESRHPGEKAADLVIRLACAKAQRAAADLPQALIIGSDQVACIEEQILGKPRDHEHAMCQLEQASGKCVIFYTGLCLLNSQTGQRQQICDPFRVFFRHLSREKIERYLHAEKPYDCAGSFKSEGLGISLCERMEGNDPTTLIGLPLIHLVSMLEQESIEVP